jgi:hypothetical protein
MRYKLVNGLSVSIVLVNDKQVILSPLETIEVEGDVKVVSSNVKVEVIEEGKKEERKK